MKQVLVLFMFVLINSNLYSQGINMDVSMDVPGDNSVTLTKTSDIILPTTSKNTVDVNLCTQEDWGCNATNVFNGINGSPGILRVTSQSTIAYCVLVDGQVYSYTSFTNGVSNYSVEVREAYGGYGMIDGGGFQDHQISAQFYVDSPLTPGLYTGQVIITLQLEPSSCLY